METMGCTPAVLSRLQPVFVLPPLLASWRASAVYYSHPTQVDFVVRPYSVLTLYPSSQAAVFPRATGPGPQYFHAGWWVGVGRGY
jgi:hypothetical protein